MSCNCHKDSFIKKDSLSNNRSSFNQFRYYEIDGPDDVATPSEQTTVKTYTIYTKDDFGNLIPADSLNCTFHIRVLSGPGGVTNNTAVFICDSWNSSGIGQCDGQETQLNITWIEIQDHTFDLVCFGSVKGKVIIELYSVWSCDNPDNESIIAGSKTQKEVHLRFPVAVGTGGGGGLPDCEFELEGPFELKSYQQGIYGPKVFDGSFTYSLNNPAWTLLHGKNSNSVFVQTPDWGYYFQRNLEPDYARLDVTKHRQNCNPTTRSIVIKGLPMAQSLPHSDWELVGANIWGYGPITGVDPGNNAFGGNWDWPNPHHNPGAVKNNQGNSFK